MICLNFNTFAFQQEKEKRKAAEAAAKFDYFARVKESIAVAPVEKLAQIGQYNDDEAYLEVKRAPMMIFCPGNQVWPLIFNVCLLLCKIIDLPEEQINGPSTGKNCSLLLPATPSSPSRTLEGLSELTRRPPRALDTSPA